jgi:hypothetical protein
MARSVKTSPLVDTAKSESSLKEKPRARSRVPKSQGASEERSEPQSVSHDRTRQEEKDPKAGAATGAVNKPKAGLSRPPMPGRELVRHFLAVLSKLTSEKGILASVLKEKCGVAWRRGLAVESHAAGEAGLADFNEFIRRRWLEGTVVLEPPKGLGKLPLLWAPENVRAVYPAAVHPDAPAPQLPVVPRGSVDGPTEGALKTAYDKFAAEHTGGYVPIFRVRRAMNAVGDKFDALLKRLALMDPPVIELLKADPQNFTEDEQADSAHLDGNLFIRMKWSQ